MDARSTFGGIPVFFECLRLDCACELAGAKTLEETATTGYGVVEWHVQPLALLECGVHHLWPTVYSRLNLPARIGQVDEF